MDYIGPIDGMNFSPISGYNNLLKNNRAFELDESGDFENILATQKMAMEKNQPQLRGGIEINTNAENFFIQNVSNTSKSNLIADNFMNSIGNSFGSGLNSVNDKVIAAERAQEALAMGENVSVHDVMIAAEKANLSMQMAIQLRNKLVTAYNEIKDVRV